jgi:hypothetical protein
LKQVRLLVRLDRMHTQFISAQDLARAESLPEDDSANETWHELLEQPLSSVPTDDLLQAITFGTKLSNSIVTILYPKVVRCNSANHTYCIVGVPKALRGDVWLFLSSRFEDLDSKSVSYLKLITAPSIYVHAIKIDLCMIPLNAHLSFVIMNTHVICQLQRERFQNMSSSRTTLDKLLCSTF